MGWAWGMAVLQVVPAWFLVMVARREPRRGMTDSLRTAIASAAIFSVCLIAEKGAFAFTPDYPLLCIAVAAPLLEEATRFFAIRVLLVSDMETGTLLGASMGLAETVIKCLAESPSPEVLAIRGFATVPFHALLGGILSRGPGNFFPAVALHSVFNFGIHMGTPWSFSISLGILGLSGLIWFLGLHHPNQEKSAERGRASRDSMGGNPG